jgi:hypothetical protein
MMHYAKTDFIRVAPASGGCGVPHSMLDVQSSMFGVLNFETSNIEHPTLNIEMLRTRRRQVLPGGFQ